MLGQDDVGSNLSLETFLDFCERYQQAKERVADALAAKRELKAEGEENGIDFEMFALACRFGDKSGELREGKMRDLLRYMAMFGKPLGLVADLAAAERAGAGNANAALFAGADLPTVNEDQRTRVEAAGYLAGHEGVPRDTNPWTPGTLLAGDWDESWQRGAEDRESEEAENPTERRGPGRPKGSRNRPKTELTEH